MASYCEEACQGRRSNPLGCFVFLAATIYETASKHNPVPRSFFWRTRGAKDMGLPIFCIGKDMAIKKEMTLEALASELKGELIGDRDFSVTNICDIEEAEKGDLAFITGKKYASFLETKRASCVIVPNEIEKARVSIIKGKNPNLAFKRAVELIAPDHIPLPKGVHKTASIGNGVALGREVALGAYAVVED